MRQPHPGAATAAACRATRSAVSGAAPGFLPDISWSDHWALSQYGIEAPMVTDTAPFRYPHDHEPTDTPDKVDTEMMARMVKGMERVIRDVAAIGGLSSVVVRATLAAW
jgi:hypothetical protein